MTNTVPILTGAESIDVRGADSGVLLLHGFGDTPQTLSYLARRLHRAGYSVFAPLLPGHGRTVSAFTQSTADEWIAATRAAFSEMRGRYEWVGVVGLSMGGALATILAADNSEIPAVALIAPYLDMPRVLRGAANTHWLWGRFAGNVNARNPRSIRDPIEREKNLAYGQVTGRALFQLLRVVRKARKALPGVRCPTLIVQSREDPRISPQVADFAIRNIGASDTKLVWTEGAGHIITVDYGRERVFDEVEAWLISHNPRRATAAT
ncbi:MAG TPA: alpha/beta fold hydrolase [Gemmatimonadaceae bacterium]|nr:alpha/beta fold hydrolase [Gemmatimonadaceae bacterium]